jgi:lipopolysaccharide export system protein LptA
MSRTTEIAAAALALALLASGAAGARTSDRSKPMDIEAARSDCGLGDNAVCTFSGQATISQGTLRIVSEKAVVTQVAGKPSRAQFSGGVTLQQEMDDGDKIDARAANVDYDMRNDVIVFTGNVSISQQRGNLSGQRVVYNLKTGQLESGGTGGGRVKMRILPTEAPASDKGAP